MCVGLGPRPPLAHRSITATTPLLCTQPGCRVPHMRLVAPAGKPSSGLRLSPLPGPGLPGSFLLPPRDPSLFPCLLLGSQFHLSIPTPLGLRMLHPGLLLFWWPQKLQSGT